MKWMLLGTFFIVFGHLEPLRAQSAKPPGQSWSSYLQDFETQPSAIDDLVHRENHRTNELFNASKNKALLTTQIAGLLDVENVLQRLTLANHSEILLQDHGLGKATEFILRTGSGDQVLLSNLSLKKNNSVAFISFALSPDQKIAVVFAEQGGSIDQYRLYVIDLSLGQVVSQEFVGMGTTVVWTGPEKFIFVTPADRKDSVEVDAQNKFAVTHYQNTTFSGRYPVSLKCGNHVQTVVLNDAQLVTLQGLNCADLQDSLHANDHQVSVVTSGDHHKLLKYAFTEQDTTAVPETLFEFDGVYQFGNFLDGHYFIRTSWGAEQKLTVLDATGEQIQTWTVPSYATIKNIQSHVVGSTVDLTLASAVASDQIFEYNYQSGQFNPAVTPFRLLMKSNTRYVSEIVMIPARDGVLIPTRMTRLASTPLTPKTPMLIEVYGGFDKPSKLLPQFNANLRNLFLNHGGVHVAPGIRGGNDYGIDWYHSAAGLKKINSLYDTIDVAQYLVAQKWTSAAKLIATGTSNGGFTVAAAALLSPESFGLVIPVSGVYDLLAFNRLDPNFASGWWRDYGNPDLPEVAANLKNFSPLELEPSSHLPNFLFVNGLNDSRVNFLHSIKMVEKLRQTLGETAKVHALFLKNAGHWVAMPTYEDYIALRENVMMWDFVYQQAGW